MNKKTTFAQDLLVFKNVRALTLAAMLTAMSVVIGILRKNGYEVKNRQFFRIGLPFTLVAVLTGYLYIWFVWA